MATDDQFDDSTDHQHILVLEKETAEQAQQIAELQAAVTSVEAEKIELVKQQNQSAIVRLVFAGICGLLVCTLLVGVVAWFSPKQDNLAIEKVMALAERVLLVLTGTLSSVAAGMFDSRKVNGGGG